MNFIKRGFISATRQKGKSIILGVITLLLAVVMITTLLMDQSTNAAKNAVIKTLPPIVELGYNDNLFSNKQPSQEEYQKLIDEHIPLTPKKVDEIYNATSDLVDYYDYSSYASVSLHKSLKRVSLTQSSYGDMGANSDYTTYASLIGSRLSDFIEYRNNIVTLKEGRLLTDEEIKSGAPSVLVPVEFAELNNLRVGDKISMMAKLQDPNNPEESAYEQLYEFEIVGLIDMKRPTQDEIDKFSENMWIYENFANTLRSSNTAVDEIAIAMMEAQKAIPEYSNGGMNFEYEVSIVQFSLKNATDSQKFVELAKTVYDTPMRKYLTQQDQVNRIAGPISQTQNLVRMVFLGTVGASVLILSLVLTLFVRDRKKEIGIYLALGEKKSKISGQLIVESLAIAIVAATIAIVFGYFLGGVLSNSMIQKALEQSSMMGMGGYMGSSTSNIDINSIVDNYKIGLDVMSILVFYFTIIATVVVAQAATALYILRFDPKKIMM